MQILYCDDCEYFRHKWGDKRFGKCLSMYRKMESDSYISAKYGGRYASSERQYGTCGPEGRNYQPKESYSFFRRVLNRFK